MPKNDTNKILLVDQPGNDELCWIRTLLDVVSKVKSADEKILAFKRQTYVQVVFPKLAKFGINVWEEK